MSWAAPLRSAAAIVIAVAGLVAGCNPRGAPNRELTIALAVFPSEAERYRGFVRDFETREHVRVQIIAETYGDILQALEVQVRGRRGSLDLAELDLAMLGQAASDVAPLDAIVPPDTHELFPDAAWSAGRVGAHLYFVPHRLMWQAMIYNRLMVPNPPATWDDLARFVREHPGKFALKAGRYEGLICDAMPFVWSAGGDECDPGAAGSLRALEFLGSLAPSLNPQSAVFREMSVLEAQARGSVWIHFNWPFAIGYLQAKGLAPSVDLSAPLPAGPDGRATPLGGGYLGIPVSAPHPQLAADFLRFLLTRATQQRLSRTLGWYGSLAPEPGSPEALLYAGYTAMRPYLRARPAVDCYTQLSNGWQRAVREVLFDRAPAAAELSELADRLSGKSGAAAARCECGERER
jgi:ABC-type glycerol-3-phosphate transport system substrate-binding protein